MRLAKIDQKFKHAKQKSNRSIDELITYVEKLKTHLSEFFEKYQKYFNFLHTLHSNFRKTMLRNRVEIFFLRKLKKLTQRFEHTKTFFDEKKFRDSDSNKVKKNFYKESNVNNVSENDDV